MYKLRLYACCILWAVVFFALPAAAHNKFCGNTPCSDIGQNSPVDSDKDGSPDYIECGDYDGDGTLEIFDDVQGCIDALTDTGNIHVYVLPGTYNPPTLTDCDAAGDACYDAISTKRGGNGGGGIIQLPSNSVLECSGPHTTTLKTWDYPTGATATTPDTQWAIIANATVAGNSNIVVRNCGLQGGGAATYTSASAGWGGAGINRGIQFYDVDDFVLEGNYCKNTHHACYFIENSRDGLLLNNTAEEDGGYNDSNGGSQASFYFHNCSEFGGATHICEDDDGESNDITVIGSRVINAVGNAFNIRNDFGVTDTLSNISIFDSYVRDNVGSCAQFRGSTNAHVSNITCDNTEGFLTSSSEGSAYREAGDNYVNVGLTIENATLSNQATSVAAMISVAAYQDGTTLRNITVNGTVDNCMALVQPQRNTVVESVVLKNCGLKGVFLTGNATNDTEGLTLKDITILDVDQFDGGHTGSRYAGFSAGAGISFIDIDGMTIKGTSETPFGVSATASADFQIKNVDITCQPPKYRGSFTETQARTPACNTNALFDTMMVTDTATDACLFLDATGAEHTFCTCSAVVTDITDITQANPGVVTTTGAHGYSNGEEVFISRVEGMIEANDTLYTVAGATANTFELGTTNTSGYTAYAVGSASGESGQWAQLVLDSTQEEDAMEFLGDIDDAVITNVIGRHCKNKNTIDATGVVTDTTFAYISAIDDPLYYDAAADDPMWTAINIGAGSSNVTIDGNTLDCINTDASKSCMILDTDHADLSARSHYVDDGGCAVACTEGALCTDWNAAAGAILFLCEDGSYNALD